MLDIAIAVGLGIITFITAYLGVHVTLHPAETNRTKKAYKVAFVVCGLLACGLIACQALRNQAVQTRLSGQIQRIETNTETPPKIEVNVPPQQPPVVNIPPQMAYMASSDLGVVATSYHLGGNLSVNATCKNMSQTAVANDTTCIRGLRVVDTKLNSLQQPIVPEATQDAMYRQFRKDISSIARERTTYGPGEYKVGTVSSPTIDEQLDTSFRNATKTVLFLGEYEWRDGAGMHVNEICEWLQIYPGLFPNPGTIAPNAQIVWNNCVHHNGLRK